MLAPGKAQKVTIYLNDDESSKQGFVHEAVLNFLFAKRIAGATLIRPDEGFGGHHQKRQQTGPHSPIRIEFIDSREVIEPLLTELLALVPDGLVEMQETTILKAAKREATL